MFEIHCIHCGVLLRNMGYIPTSQQHGCPDCYDAQAIWLNYVEHIHRGE